MALPTETKPVGAWLVFCLAALVLLRMLVADVHRGEKHGPDYQIYLNAAERLNKGEPLYATTYSNGYVYTPLVAVALQPLARLPEEHAKDLFWLAISASLAVSVALYAWGAGWRAREQVLILLAVLMAFRFRPTMLNLFWGQVNPMLFVVVCGLLVAVRHRAWKTYGVLVALGALIKTWMAGFLLYPLLRRHWSAGVSFGVSLAASLAGLFALVGFHELPAFVGATLAKSSQSELISDSWAGFARLHLASNPLMPPAFDAPALFYLFLLAGLVIFGAMMAQLARLPEPMSDEDLQLRWGMFTATLILALPLAHLEYYVLLLPLMWAVLSLAGRREAWGLAAAAMAGVAYLALTVRWRPVGSGYEGPPGSRSLLVHANFFIACALWLVGAASLWRLHAGTLSLLGSARRGGTPAAADPAPSTP